MSCLPLEPCPSTDVKKHPRVARNLFFLLWAALLAAACWYVIHFGRTFPVLDEMVMMPITTGERPITLAWLWNWHNDHRIPLPKLFCAAFWWIGGGDVRAGMLANALLLSACAILFALTRRKITGRTTFADLLFPAIFMHLGMAENLLLSFQIHFVLSAAIMCLLWFFATSLRAGVTLPRVAGLCAVALTLPLCGGTTVAFAPPVLLLLTAMVWLIPKETSRRRTLQLVLALTVVMLTALCAAYLSGYQRTVAVPWNLLSFLRAAWQFTGTAWGPGAGAAMPYLGLATILLCVVAAAVCVRGAIKSRGNERIVYVAWLALLVGSGLLVAAIAAGRGMLGPDWSMTPRYASLMAPLIAGISVVFSGVEVKPLRWVPSALAVAAMLLLVPNVIFGVRLGDDRALVDRRLALDFQRGVPIDALATMYAGDYLAGQADLARQHFAMLRKHHLGPFIPRPARKTPAPAENIPLSIEPVELHDFARAQDGWWETTGSDPFFVLSLPEDRDLRGVEIEFEMQHSAPDATVTGTRFMWAQTPMETFKSRRGYWLSQPMPQGRTTWKFWMYAKANAVRIHLDWRPYRIKLIAARAIVGPVAPAE